MGKIIKANLNSQWIYAYYAQSIGGLPTGFGTNICNRREINENKLHREKKQTAISTVLSPNCDRLKYSE